MVSRTTTLQVACQTPCQKACQYVQQFGHKRPTNDVATPLAIWAICTMQERGVAIKILGYENEVLFVLLLIKLLVVV